jgi:hypothetical protein
MLTTGVTNDDMHVLYESTERGDLTDGELYISPTDVPISGTKFDAVDYADDLGSTINAQSWSFSKSSHNYSALDDTPINSPHEYHRYYIDANTTDNHITTCVVNGIAFMFAENNTNCRNRHRSRNYQKPSHRVLWRRRQFTVYVIAGLSYCVGL